jgi:hypothetical protein
MKKFIHSQNWHYLTGEQIVQLFDEHFPDVTIQPNYDMVMQLKALEAATLECLENRTSSTVYRIKQTGVVYHLCQPNGDLFEYDDYEGYQQDKPVDELIEKYADDEPVHVAYEKDGKLYIERKKHPRLKGVYTPENPMSHISDIEWIDQPRPTEIANVLRKAGAFLQSYFKSK